MTKQAREIVAPFAFGVACGVLFLALPQPSQPQELVSEGLKIAGPVASILALAFAILMGAKDKPQFESLRKGGHVEALGRYLLEAAFVCLASALLGAFIIGYEAAGSWLAIWVGFGGWAIAALIRIFMLSVRILRL